MILGPPHQDLLGEHGTGDEIRQPGDQIRPTAMPPRQVRARGPLVAKGDFDAFLAKLGP
jgi:hypothetical protein